MTRSGLRALAALFTAALLVGCPRPDIPGPALGVWEVQWGDDIDMSPVVLITFYEDGTLIEEDDVGPPRVGTWQTLDDDRIEFAWTVFHIETVFTVTLLGPEDPTLATAVLMQGEFTNLFGDGEVVGQRISATPEPEEEEEEEDEVPA